MSLDVLVVTVVHDPEDARIRHREIPALLAAGHRVTYAAPFSAYGRTPPSGTAALDLPRAQGRRRGRALVAARRLLARRRAAGCDDVVLLHDPDLLLAVAGRTGGPGERPVVVWDVHEDTAAALGMRGWLPAPLRRPAAVAVRAGERWAERRLRLLLAEEGYRPRFVHEHPVVPNSVLVPAEDPPPPGADRVVYLGRLTRSRGALDLLEVGRLLRGRVRVELVGPADGDVRDELARAAAAGDVVWHGFLPNARALGLLPGALAGLSLLHDEPNYAHSRPTKVMEYMAYGVPVVTTPNAASAELVQTHACGRIVPFGDPAAAAEAVAALAADPPQRVALGRAGRRAAMAHHDWAADGTRFAALLEDWAARPG